MATFMKEFFWPLLVVFLTPAVTAGGGIVAKSDWRAWFIAIPPALFVIVSIILLGWFAVAAIRTRNVNIRAGADTPLAIGYTPAHGWVRVMQISHAGAKWIVRAPRAVTERAGPGDFAFYANAMEALTPRCPKCETELSEFEDWLRYRVWKCPSCPWHRRSALTQESVSSDVVKIARRQVEIRTDASPPNTTPD